MPSSSGLLPLSQELKIVRDYLEIEKTRFGQRLRYEINVPPSVDDVKCRRWHCSRWWKTP